MWYLGIDQHARQITISLRDEHGDVLQARQVSTHPERLVLVIVILNVTLAFFNILPIPPLDGYNFAMAFLPFRLALQVQQLAQYGLLVLLGLVLLSRLAPGASPLDWLFTGADGLARLLTGA